MKAAKIKAPDLTVKLSTKGQFVVPKDLPVTRLQDLIGCTGYKGSAKSLAEMDQDIAVGARRSR